MIIEKDKILYSETFKDIKVHAVNRAYWSKIIKKHTSTKYTNEWQKFFPSCKERYDDCYAPVVLYYNSELNKGIRIIQFDPSVYDRKYKFKQWLTAWVSKINIDDNEAPELVIYTLLTHNNSYMAEQLINYWINNEQTKLNALISNIYIGQKE